MLKFKVFAYYLLTYPPPALAFSKHFSLKHRLFARDFFYLEWCIDVGKSVYKLTHLPVAPLQMILEKIRLTNILFWRKNAFCCRKIIYRKL